MNDGKVNEVIKKLSALLDNLLNPQMVEELVQIPYSPDKTSAKASAAIIGNVIPAASRSMGFPVIELGGMTSVWVGTHYEPITEHHRFELVKTVAKKALLLKPNILTSEFKKELVKAMEQAGQPENIFGFGHRPIQGINFEDGLLIFTTAGHRFRPGHEAEDLTTYCIPGRWNGRKDSKLWLRFMEEAIPDEDIRQYVLASFGNAIASDPLKAQKILLLIGAAGAGKSTMIEAIANCIGNHNVMRSDNLSQITRDDSRHRMKLAHATLCVSADASANLGDKDSLKMIVSKERIIARKLYSEPIEVLPRASLIVASNQMSLSHALSDPGVARRFDIITFRSAKEASKRDPSLPNKLASEENRAGIGKSLAEALIDIMQKSNNKLKRPHSLQQELDNLRREGDPLSSYLDHLGLSVEVDPLCNTAEVHQDTLYREFKLFCSDNGYKEWSIRKFKSRLRDMGAEERDAGSRKHKYTMKCQDLLRLKKARLII